MHIPELVYLYGDDAIPKIYEEIDRRLLEFRDWLTRQGGRFQGREAEIHLANGHYLVEFMAEDSPCLFPEEVIDHDDTPQAIADETSTTYGFKQFIYCTYICKGPGPGELTDHILESVHLYYEYLLQSELAFRIPSVVEAVVNDKAYFKKRCDDFNRLNEKYAEDEAAWNTAFDRWAVSF